MTYTRVAGHSLPPMLSTSVWFSHVNDTARYISHAEYSRDLNRVTQDKEFRKVVRDKAGRDMYERMREWVQDQARPDRRLLSTMDRALDKQRKLATIAILGANISVGLKQRLSMFSAQPVLFNTSLFGMEVIVDVYHLTVLQKVHRKHPAEEIDSRTLLLSSGSAGSNAWSMASMALACCWQRPVRLQAEQCQRLG